MIRDKTITAKNQRKKVFKGYRRKRRSKSKIKKLFVPGIVVLFVVAAAILLVIFPQREPQPPVLEGVPASLEGNTLLQSLLGQWVRPDGGYVILIRNVHPNGRMEVEYLTPRPIHVSRAEALVRGDAVDMIIELNEVGYPGSTYTLSWKEGDDVLTGVYYHAGQRRNYEVLFLRAQ